MGIEQIFMTEDGNRPEEVAKRKVADLRAVNAELLAALEVARSWVIVVGGRYSVPPEGTMEKIDAAIAKARGDA